MISIIVNKVVKKQQIETKQRAKFNNYIFHFKYLELYKHQQSYAYSVLKDG